ncbi:MAG: response regulator [Lunatimonas sp.]|uniref:hybrid sensor histidine kinase/response regulator transcription factor n=1 Tax=Lunatimonas sp. TaxID=2060141 RepID=UPI00263BBFF7|nr:two-component regulator propeller domain-containing protein [Lunatimonas sp.]MCC5937100.1 response regulator [Lunatimonas sp.]
MLFFGSFFSYSQQGYREFIPVEPAILSNTFVKCFLKDRMGFMWMGTADGLMRYDGTNVVHFEHSPEDPYSIPHNTVNVVLEDSLNNLWVGTSQGLSIYERNLDRFLPIDSLIGIQNSLNNRYVTSLVSDRLGRVWIGTHGNGVNVFDPKGMMFTYLDGLDFRTPAPSQYINHLAVINDEIWCGTKGGLKVYKVGTMEPVDVPPIIGRDMRNEQVTQVVKGREGDVMVSTLSGRIISLVPRNGYYFQQDLIPGDLTANGTMKSTLSLVQAENGDVWVGGEFSGLNVIQAKRGGVTRLSQQGENSFPTSSIRAIYEDDEGFVWIGTFNKGAYLLRNNVPNFDDYQKGPFSEAVLRGKNVRGFAEDPVGRVWMAYDELGLVIYDPRTQSLGKPPFPIETLDTNYLTALAFDRNGDLWIGTESRGIFRYSLKSKSISRFELRSNGFGDNNVFSIYEDRRGRIWAGTIGSGLFYYNQSVNQFELLCEEDKPDFITRTSYVSSYAEDADGTFWVGTMYGLYALTPLAAGGYSYRLFLHAPGDSLGLSSSTIQTLFLDERNNLWVGTADNGLNVKRNGSDHFEVFRSKDGLGSNAIRGITTDMHGDLWIAGSRGISKMSMEERSFTNFSQLDGLSSNNFIHNAILRARDGKLFFGNNNGFNAFLPEDMLPNEKPPRLYLTDFKINNQSVLVGAPRSPLKEHISISTSLELTADQRSFVLEYVAVGYGYPNRHQYCYMLEGFDKDWNCAVNNLQATYTNIDPGTYTFLVKASNSDGVWSEDPVRLEIRVLPRIWDTWWARLGYLLVFGALLTFFYKFRMERVKMKSQLQFERMAREREHEISESKTQFFTNVSHELRTPLSLILMPLEGLKDSPKLSKAAMDKVQTAYNSAKKMMGLVNELLEFNKLENGSVKLNLKYGEVIRFLDELMANFRGLAEQKEVAFTLHSDREEIWTWFDADKLEKIMANILSNAFKFTPDSGKITIRVTCRPAKRKSDGGAQWLELQVVDNGIGISASELPFIFNKFFQAKSADAIPNPGTGIGLAFARSLAEQHLGTITAQSIPHERTTFTVQLPLGEAAYREKGLLATELDAASSAAELEEAVSEEKAKRQLLIVEDNDELRMYLVAEFEDEFEVLDAKDGEEGLRLAVDHVPDLVLSDVLMPKMSGLEICRELKSNMKTSHIPVVLLTAKATVDDQVSGIENGADLYITKPFSIRVLKASVVKLIDSRIELFAKFSQEVYLTPSKLAGSKLEEEFLQQVVGYIESNIQDSQLGVDAIADNLNLSRTQVYRKIKALTGKSVVEFIRTVRLKKAIKYMDTKKYSLGEISFLVGFSSPSYFTRSFRETFGKAPSEYIRD